MKIPDDVIKCLAAECATAIDGLKSRDMAKVMASFVDEGKIAGLTVDQNGAATIFADGSALVDIDNERGRHACVLTASTVTKILLHYYPYDDFGTLNMIKPPTMPSKSRH